MKSRKVKSTARLNKRKVEEGILMFLEGGTATSVDVEFGEAEIKFTSENKFDRGLGFREFDIDNIRYKLATKDPRRLTITYLFHKIK